MRSNVFPTWLKWMLISAGLVSLIAVSSLVFLVAGVMSESLRDKPLNPASNNGGGTSAEVNGIKPVIVVEYDEIPITPISDEDTASIPIAEPLPTLTNRDRLTILLMGLDRRPNETYPTRTDTMILLSLDPETNQASMLSIPRDLYVDIPGIGRERINAAYVLGALRNGGEAAGAQLAMDTVERNLGVHVDHYVLVDFNAVVNLIDAFGGLEINVEKTIDDPLYPDMNYGYDPLYIPAGQQTLDGWTALKYMRTRHGDSDFDRARRQQKAMLALREQVLGVGVTGLARRVPTIWDEVKEGIFTDMSLNDILALVNAATELSAESINTGVIDYTYAYSYQTSGGASVLILRTEEVATLIASLFD
ncbi:MAG TPA: hypothetical protein ENJ56_07445 [Anaerolineae bacterium]|nr:hypothetical protein [Anaerolineae bacterium]